MTIDLSQLKTTREGFGEGLVQAGRANDAVMALCADLTESTKMDGFKKEFPKRFIEIGVAEQNLVTVASGLAASGKIPFVSSYAVFSPGRNWEQIRTTICYNDRKVVIVGSHSGVSVGPDGGSHQALEDIAMMRVLPNMTVVVPCDAIETRKATLALASDSVKTPAYLRLTREKTPVMTDDDTPFEIGRASMLLDSPMPSVGIVGCGPILSEAIIASEKLKEKGIRVPVMNMATVKPIDVIALVGLAKKVSCILTIEEHQVAGGLGSAVAEVLSEHCPTKLIRVGVQNRFGQSGTPAELIQQYGLGADSIVEKILATLI